MFFNNMSYGIRPMLHPEASIPMVFTVNGDSVMDLFQPAFDGQIAEFMMGGGNPPPPAASVEVVNNLPLSTIQEKEVCPICQSDMDVGDRALLLPCTHKFHPDCVKPWLATHNTCPTCRYQLDTDDPVYNAQLRRLRGEQPQETVSTVSVSAPRPTSSNPSRTVTISPHSSTSLGTQQQPQQQQQQQDQRVRVLRMIPPFHGSRPGPREEVRIVQFVPPFQSPRSQRVLSDSDQSHRVIILSDGRDARRAPANLSREEAILESALNELDALESRQVVPRPSMSTRPPRPTISTSTSLVTRPRPSVAAPDSQPNVRISPNSNLADTGNSSLVLAAHLQALSAHAHLMEAHARFTANPSGLSREQEGRIHMQAMNAHANLIETHMRLSTPSAPAPSSQPAESSRATRPARTTNTQSTNVRPTTGNDATPATTSGTTNAKAPEARRETRSRSLEETFSRNLQEYFQGGSQKRQRN